MKIPDTLFLGSADSQNLVFFHGFQLREKKNLFRHLQTILFLCARRCVRNVVLFANCLQIASQLKSDPFEFLAGKAESKLSKVIRTVPKLSTLALDAILVMKETLYGNVTHIFGILRESRVRNTPNILGLVNFWPINRRLKKIGHFRVCHF